MSINTRYSKVNVYILYFMRMALCSYSLPSQPVTSKPHPIPRPCSNNQLWVKTVDLKRALISIEKKKTVCFEWKVV